MSAFSRRAPAPTSTPPPRPVPAHRATRVGLVGAGFIAAHHLDALADTPDVELAALCDLDGTRARELAGRYEIPGAYDDLDSMLREASLDAAHVLVPPQHHARVIRQVLDAGVHVLAEKPLAPESDTCRELARHAAANGARLGVNHNFLFHPAFERLVADVEAGAVGPPSHVRSVTHVPLRQLATGEFDHWMFRHPGNILLEQAPHPLGQVFRILGPARDVDVQTSDRRQLGERTFFGTWQITLACERGTASVHLSFGHDSGYSVITALGRDGMARADLGLGTYTLRRRSRYIEPVDLTVTALREARDLARDGIAQLAAYAGSLLPGGSRSDAFYRTMRGSIGAFHAALRSGDPLPVDAADGARVVATCERVIEQIVPPAPRAVVSGPGHAPRPVVDALVLGGSGFIGRHLVRRLRAAGLELRVGSRRPDSLDTADDPAIDPFPVDLRDRESVFRAVRGARTVIHLAAGVYEDWEQYRRVYLDGLRHVIDACAEAGVRRLVYTSTIAAYYLGHRRARIDEDTPLDPLPNRRNLYARAKIEAERILEAAGDGELDTVVLRPGVVVGSGGIVQHTGVGLWPSPIHCLGWGRGDIPLPFVLADDVADALVSAATTSHLSRGSYNLVGDVRLTAREYVDEVGRADRRRIDFHPQPIGRLWALELFKYAVKKAAGKPAEAPAYRDLKTRTLASRFDCAAAKRDLHWNPEAERSAFVERGIVAALDRREES